MKLYTIDFEPKYGYGVNELLVAARNIYEAISIAKEHLITHKDQVTKFYIQRIPRANIRRPKAIVISETYYFE